MPTYVFECINPDCEIYELEFEANVPISQRDLQYCAYCGEQYRRKIAFTGLTWAPTAGGMR